MACQYCDHRGYIKIQVLQSATTAGHVRPCPKCNDTKAYYRYIKEKYGNTTTKNQNTECEVIPLKDRRK